jgi:TRAP-type mannitol/chloroaromatic compound transport system substrate-binding protein
VFDWKGQTHIAAGDPRYIAIDEMAQQVASSSGGRLMLNLHAPGALVPQAKEFDAIDSRVLDWGLTAYAYWKDKFNAAAMFTFTVAGLSPAEQILWHLVGGGDELAQRMVEGYDVKLFTGQATPPETFLYSSKEIKSVADIKGLRIRTAGDDGEIFTRMGASVVFLPGGEVYEAMQRGVIDAFQTTYPAGDYSQGRHEVAQYIYLSPARQPAEFHSYLVNTDSWASLPDDLKALLEDAFLASAWRTYADVTWVDTEAVDKFIEYGNTVGPIPKDVEDEMVRLADEFYREQSAEDPFFAEVYDSITAFQQRYRTAYARL